jgi:hypothetical protein
MRGLSLLREASERGARPARVLLLTDGIANRGVVEPASIAAGAQPFLRSGIELSVIGVGRDVQTDLLRRLADEGRGLFHFVADGKDLEKVFTEDAQSLIDVVARDARIVVEHDPALRVARVYGHRHEIAPGRLTIAIDTLNLGMTEVAIVEFEPCRPTDQRTRLPVRASLSFVPSTTDDACAPVRLEQVASIDLVASATCVEPTDPEVRKNHTLAVLGQAMFDVATACDGSRFEVARNAADTGLATARARYPKTDDADLNAAMSMLTGFGDAITRRLDAHRPNVTSTPFDR